MDSKGKYENFQRELTTHSAGGYHVILRTSAKLSEENVNESYLSFLSLIGYGSFFAGALQIFDLQDDGAKQIAAELEGVLDHNYLIIGYDGTTEGCFAVEKISADTGVYYINRQQPNDITKISDSFNKWMDSATEEYFDSKLYSAFRKIKDIEGIKSVIKDRNAIKVELVKYEKELVALPDAEKQYLKRYNKVVLNLQIAKKVTLEHLTIKLARTGSEVGNDNVEYVTIPLNKKEGSFIVEAYLFDPFNVPFDTIVCLYQAEINLNSKMRLKYKEIQAFL